MKNIIRYFDVCFIGIHDNLALYKHGISVNKYFDYMLAGKPILDSNNLIKDAVEVCGCGIIVPPGSASEIEAGILKFYNMNASDRALMGGKGKAYVLSNHSIKFLSQKYLNAITE